MKSLKTIPCIGCGANVPNSDGPIHKYLGASAGCWQIFGEVLAKEFSDPEYMKVHRLTVDAYALQHLGVKSPQTIQSMNLHLLALCAAFEHEITYDFIPKIMNKRLKHYKDNKIFSWLTPPSCLGEITIIDIATATTAKQHEKLVEKWAKEVWKLWQPHHKQIDQYYSEINYYNK